MAELPPLDPQLEEQIRTWFNTTDSIAFADGRIEIFHPEGGFLQWGPERQSGLNGVNGEIFLGSNACVFRPNGSALFSNGDFEVLSNGSLVVNGATGITDDVDVGNKTLHIVNGIIVSVTPN